MFHSSTRITTSNSRISLSPQRQTVIVWFFYYGLARKCTAYCKWPHRRPCTYSCSSGIKRTDALYEHMYVLLVPGRACSLLGVRFKCQLPSQLEGIRYDTATSSGTGCRIHVILQKNDVEQVSHNSQVAVHCHVHSWTLLSIAEYSLALQTCLQCQVDC